jgi:6-phosphogluconate dehydrogenase
LLTAAADGAGHYVKMVHNGIEYGDMQLISEVNADFSNFIFTVADFKNRPTIS